MKNFSKTDVRYWRERVYHRNRGTENDTDWNAQIQHLGHREQFPLHTANREVAAAKARDIYLALHANGWESTLALYKPGVEKKVHGSTIGDLIRAIDETSDYRSTTFTVYCSALRRIAKDLAEIKGTKKRFAPNGVENVKWRERINGLPLSILDNDAIQKWKLDFINKRKSSPVDHALAVNSVNAYIRNARSLFSPKALAFAAKRLTLPDPLPFSKIKLESSRGTTRYSSRIDAAALLLDARKELFGDPSRHEQFKIFCLALLCGLRKREIDTLLWRSVDFSKAVVRVERTEYFIPKSEESAGEIDLSSELLELLKSFKAVAKGEFIIESPNPARYHVSRTNYRAQVDFEALYSWLAEKGVSARKKLHELRKECGAVIANNMGIFAASRALRHSDIRVTSQYYADKKVRITTGLDSLLSSERSSIQVAA